MRMLERSTRGFSMILEQQDVVQPPVLLEIEHTFAKRPQHIFYLLVAHGTQGRDMIRRFDDHLMGPYAIHAIKQTVAFAVEVNLPDELFEQASRVIAELNVSMKEAR